MTESHGMVNVPVSVAWSAVDTARDTVPAPPHALQRLHEQATRCADDLSRAMGTIAGAPYHAELARLRQHLSVGDVEGALNAWRSIPWVFETESGYGGLAFYEQRDLRVRKAARALDAALGQMKVCSRYGWLPQSTPPDGAADLVLF